MGKESDQSKKCPECGGPTVWDADTEETFCSECGMVITEAGGVETSGTESSEEEWTAFESAEGDQDNGGGKDSAPETVTEWKMWYPCPVCGSTELNQIIKSHLSVTATKDGSYGGESSIEEYNSVECSNCGETLLDEIEA